VHDGPEEVVGRVREILNATGVVLGGHVGDGPHLVLVEERLEPLEVTLLGSGHQLRHERVRVVELRVLEVLERGQLLVECLQVLADFRAERRLFCPEGFVGDEDGLDVVNRVFEMAVLHLREVQVVLLDEGPPLDAGQVLVLGVAQCHVDYWKKEGHTGEVLVHNFLNILGCAFSEREPSLHECDLPPSVFRSKYDFRGLRLEKSLDPLGPLGCY